MKNLLTHHVAAVLFSVILFSSCISPKSITYINNLPQAQLINLDSLAAPQPIIVVNDAIEIHIGGENEKTVQYINQYFSGGGGATSSATGTGGGGGMGNQYTVDIDGYITLPKLGKVKMAGLTRDEAKDTLTNLYSQFLIDPIVSVRFSNFRFSVIGEVKAPGTFTVPSEKINIFEALAQAGDITEFGRYEKVHILRDKNGKRQIITVDLTDKSILNSPNYYINRYDLIYVESRNLKYVTDNISRAVTFIGAALSIVAIILVLK